MTNQNTKTKDSVLTYKHMSVADGELRIVEPVRYPKRSCEDPRYYLITAHVVLSDGSVVAYADVMPLSVVRKEEMLWPMCSNDTEWVTKRLVQGLVEDTHGVVPPYVVLYSRAVFLFEWEARAIMQAPQYSYILDRWNKAS
jgi:hypothetical protein